VAERYSLQDPCARFGPLRRTCLEAPPFCLLAGKERSTVRLLLPVIPFTTQVDPPTVLLHRTDLEAPPFCPLAGKERSPVRLLLPVIPFTT